MNKKLKRNMLLMTGLTGSLIAATAAGAVLSSCTTTTSTSSGDVQYSYVIDWSNPTLVDRLTIDSNGLVYSDDSMTTIIATSPNITSTTIKIPSTVKNITGYAKVVTDSNGVKTYQSVGAFQDNALVQSIVLESSSNLQSIGSLAFSGCTNLKTITGVTSNLTFVGSNAFTNCTNLTTIDLSNVLNVGEYAFQNCSSLSINNLSKVLTIGQYAFNGALDESAKTALDLASVTSIGQYAFSGSNIFSVDLSKNTNLATLGNYAFSGCTNLSGTIDLSNCSLLTSIGQYAFSGNTELTTVYIPSENTSKLTTIGQYAFDGCTSLETVAPSGQTGFVATSKITNIGGYAFQNTIIKSIDFSTTTISNSDSRLDDSFKNMHYVETVKVSNSLEQVSMTMFNYVGDQGAGFELVLPSTLTNFAVRSSGSAYSGGTMTYAPFANSGLKLIDMSAIKSYDTSSSSTTTSVNPGQFWNATKLETVILKEGTTRFWHRVFEGCSNLKVVREPDQTYTSGFVAKNTLQTINTDIFTNAITEGQEFPVDLTALSFESTLTGLSNSNITSLKLPTTVTTIADNSFVGMTKLTSVNFESLTNLTTIGKNNFSGSQLTNIDLSNSKLTKVDTGSFTNLPATAVASFPTTLAGGFSNIFTTTDAEGNTTSISFSFPNGINDTFISSYITSNTLQNLTTSSSDSAKNVLTNLSSLNLASNTTINSVGVNTFFGNTKLTSLTLNGSGISNSSIFTSAASGITANTTNTTATSGYAVANIPFGNNTAFTSLNYSGFTANAASATATTTETLFNTTNNTTWTEVAKIINSLSYQASPTTATAAAALKPNMSAWTVVDGATSAVNTDAAMTWAAAVAGSNSVAAKPAQITVTNSFKTSNDGSSADIVITAATASATIVHNGVVWTYTNDGTNITLKATNVNMYKATNGNNSYLTFFNELAWKENDTATTTYYVPATQSVNVTLTIATASSNAS